MKLAMVGLAGAVLCAKAGAAIVGVSAGVVQLGSPPAGPSALLPPPFAMAWDELQAISVTSLSVDNGPGPWFAPPSAPTSVSGPVDSHMLHWTTDHSGGIVFGSVQFSGPIVGVMYSGAALAASDPICGLGPTVYLSGDPGRFMDGGSALWILPGSLDTLHFEFLSTSPAHQYTEVRVVTRVPAPGALGLAGTAGLMALRRRR